MTKVESKKIIPVILSGGMGTRLWPLSRGNHPKQFHNLSSGELSLIQETCQRVTNRNIFEAPIVICNENHRFLVADSLLQLGITDASIILEPCGRNTAPAIALVAAFIAEKFSNAHMLILPSDHIITDEPAFLTAVNDGYALAKQGNLVTFGITPTHAETGYGYIKYGKELSHGGFAVERFVEKPDADTAEKYLASKEYGWNSGIFLFPVALFTEELTALQPDMVKLATKASQNQSKDLDFIRIAEKDFAPIASESIDYALMEHTKKAAVIPVDCGWNDAGSWESLWRISEKDKNGIVQIGDSFTVDSKNCFINCNDGTRIAALGVEDLIIISTKDCMLVAHKDKSQDVRKMVEHIQKTDPDLIENYRQVYRPWGHYDSINEGERHKVKRISVKPGGQISLQMHNHRAEHWIVVRGTAHVEVDGKCSTIFENESTYIPVGTSHRLENKGKIELVIIEVQSGSYLGEDDIIRFEDNYGRVEKQA